jgi:hypothetical protein
LGSISIKHLVCETPAIAPTPELTRTSEKGQDQTYDCEQTIRVERIEPQAELTRLS